VALCIWTTVSSRKLTRITVQQAVTDRHEGIRTMTYGVRACAVICRCVDACAGPWSD
jgi:hypothetical protein